MTPRPDAPELSAAELRFLDRPDEPESLRERVAAALWEEAQATAFMTVDPTERNRQERYRRLADAALAVVRGETS